MLEIAPLFSFPAKIFGYPRSFSYIYPVNNEKIKVMWYLMVFILMGLLRLVWKYKFLYMILVILGLVIYYNTDGIIDFSNEYIVPFTEDLNVYIEKWNASEFTKKTY